MAGGVTMAQDEELRKDWPPGVETIGWKNLNRLGVGQDGGLYWDGRPIVTRSRLDLTFRQRLAAWVTALAIIAGGLGSFAAGLDAGHSFGCKLHWWTRGCRSDEPNGARSARIGTGSRGESTAWP
jgi:hypothetical protein